MEYRGYDSCGVAVVDDGQLKRSRTVKRVQDLIRQTEEDELKGSTGIAHTRWATHGAPEIRNTHPLFSNNQIAVVHNGIIENYAAIKEELIGKGYEFVSQTDTEVIAHLVHYYYKGDLLGAVENVLRRIRGAFALAISCKDEPGRIVAARVAAPLDCFRRKRKLRCLRSHGLSRRYRPLYLSRRRRCCRCSAAVRRDLQSSGRSVCPR